MEQTSFGLALILEDAATLLKVVQVLYGVLLECFKMPMDRLWRLSISAGLDYPLVWGQSIAISRNWLATL